jgi:prepilin-type N-terminal cleavage/methylation domain-containing protein
MKKILRKQNGVSLIELLVALVISIFLIASIYWTFIQQQKTFTTQEQVVDIQQNIRFAISIMMREIKMAGFGNISMVLPATINGRTYNNIVNPETPVANALTILSATNPVATLTTEGGVSNSQIVVSTLTDNQGNQLFDTNNKKYISIGGVESNVITAVDPGTRTLTLTGPLGFKHEVGTPVFTIRALSYQVLVENGIPILKKDDGGGSQPVADGIEMLQFQYLDGNGIVTATPSNIRIIRVSMTARTERQDLDYKDGGGYRRREIASNIHLRNMGL